MGINLQEVLLNAPFNEREIELNGQKFIVREMDGGEAEEYENSLYKITNRKVETNTKDAKGKMIQLCLYDLDGKKVFSKSDMATIKKMPAHVANKIFDIATELNSMDPEKQEKN